MRLMERQPVNSMGCLFSCLYFFSCFFCARYWLLHSAEQNRLSCFSAINTFPQFLHMWIGLSVSVSMKLNTSVIASIRE